MDLTCRIPDGSKAASPVDEPPSLKFDLISLAILSVFVLILMYPFVFGGRAVMPDTWKSIHPWARGLESTDYDASIYDTVLEYGPWFEYSQQCLKEGRVPHWNPWQFCGTPLYANRLIPFFYPPFIIAELVAQPHKIIGWFQLFNLLISGWGMFFLLRRWRVSRTVSVMGSMLWLTSGVHFLPFPLWTLGVVNFPWLLWALEGFLEKPSGRPMVLSAFIYGIILMTGYPVLVVHMTYFTVLYFLSRWWTAHRVGEKSIHWSLPAVALLAMFTFGAGLSAIANYPAWKYSQETFRQVGGFTDKAFEREKRMLITPPAEAGLDPVEQRFGQRADILLPINGRGTQRAWQYAGITTYLLTCLGIIAWRPRAKLLAILGLLFGLIVWIPEIYIFLLDILPGWSVTILLPIEVVNFIAVVLAAFGIEALINIVEKGQSVKLLGKIIFAIFALVSIFTTYWFFKYAPVASLPFLENIPDPNLLETSGWHYEYMTIHSIIAVAIAFMLFMPRICRHIPYVAVIAVLLFSATNFHYQQPVYSQPDYTPETSFISDWASRASEIENPADGNRIARWADLPLPFDPHRRLKSPFTPNLHLGYELADVGGYDSLVPARYLRYMTLFEDPFIDYRALIAFKAGSTIYHRRFRALGVRWIISQDELPSESQFGMPPHEIPFYENPDKSPLACTLVWDARTDSDREGTDENDDFMQVWEINNPMPRAFLTRRIAFSNDPFDDPLVQGENWAARGMHMIVVEDPEGENRTFAWPDDEIPVNDPNLVLPGSSVRIVTDDPEYVVLDVNAPDDCYLVLRDGWFPCWTCKIDDEFVDIYPADAAFRAVKVPSGNHKVEFIFVAGNFNTGALISIITIILMCFVYWVSGGKTRNIKPTPTNR